MAIRQTSPLMLLPSLSNQQSDAIDTDRNRLVVACPGSGKTRVALAKAIKSAVPLLGSRSRVLMLTFTKQAQHEFERRIIAHAGCSLEDAIETSTMNAWVLNRLIAPYGAYVRDGGLKLVLEGSAVYEEAALQAASENNISCEVLLRGISYTYRLLDGTPAQRGKPVTGLLGSAIVDFWNKLFEQGYVDFANSMYIGIELLRNFKWVTCGLAARYPLVIVDEFQDCNPNQLSILGELESAGSTLFLVGDYYQCIYAFTGVNDDLLAVFVAAIGADERVLSGSYRCSQNILDLAERLFKRRLVSIGDSLAIGGAVQEVTSYASVDELRTFIQGCIRSGVAPEEIAFIAAQNEQVEKVVAALRDKGIRATVGKRKNKEWFEEYIEAAILADPPLASEDLDTLVDQTLAVAERLLPTGANCELPRAIILRSLAATVKFVPRYSGKTLRDILDAVCERFFTVLRASGVVPRAILDEMINRLSQHLANGGKDWEAYLDQRLLETKERLRPRGCVRGYTFHGVKGLEFDAVALIELYPPFIPNPYEREKTQTTRLLYVGVTRAKTHLMLQLPADSRVREHFQPADF